MQGNQGNPPGGGFGNPPGNGGFGAPPSGGFGPPPSGGFGAPPSGGFGPPPGGGFGPPPGGGFEGGTPPQVDPLAIASAALGALSLFLCWCGCIGIPLALGGAATGVMALSKANQPGGNPTSKTLAIVGLGLSGFALLLDIASFFLGLGANVLEYMSRFR